MKMCWRESGFNETDNGREYAVWEMSSLKEHPFQKAKVTDLEFLKAE